MTLTPDEGSGPTQYTNPGLDAELYSDLMNYLSLQRGAANLALRLRESQGASRQREGRFLAGVYVRNTDTLDTRPFARTSDPDTSHAAAASLTRTNEYVDRAVDFLTYHDKPEGWTWDELEQQDLDLGACGWHRLTDARRKGLIEWVKDEEGHTLTRRSRAGRLQGASRITRATLERSWAAALDASDEAARGI